MRNERDRGPGRVLLVSNGFPPEGQWGTEFYTHQLASGMQARGREVAVFLPVRNPAAERYSMRKRHRHGLDLFELVNCGDPAKGFRDSYQNEGVERAFASVLSEFRPAVVHFNHLLWGLSVGLPRLAAEFGARVVATVTDLGLLCHRGQFFDSRLEVCGGPLSAAECARCIRDPSRHDASSLELVARRAAVHSVARIGGLGRIVVARDVEERADIIREAVEYIDEWVFPTRALMGAFQASGLAVGDARVLPYGIDEAAFELPATEPARPGFRFAFFGQFMPHKGLEPLLEAVRLMESRLPESVAPWSVRCWGHGSLGRHRLYGPRAFELVRGSRRVVDAGCFPPLDAPRVMAETDALIVPSLWMENAPLTILQARAAGLPVIASDVSGVREVLEPGRHGVLVPAADAGALADAMRSSLLAGPRRYAPDPVVRHADHLDAIEALYGDQAGCTIPRPQPTAEPVDGGAAALMGAVEA